ncbi:uncharacterized protein MONOS_6150 [Monocercomonoides exilis]|uniref:uncharacterized protein n=1 Tax=Monocercomonoides exilis TaxID=2049356 RepID=UPI003559B274|nr:hypothetical protein MONOS_6150 [Monocercomonoides exilis]|eukprot:MONOS_6150.1-p1 / transcript=MONOS_6150.1 / gene=MONOS_6150 / organism=Monocercomonoides_exilis_PA203 / gene_product=unspecified product / transcript_product=unspecified product / location=Mono_scaffold00190:11724-12820(-) / protein_length=104 / sequence_SO=supercontig / SO=protein_coding / is_pseudo=false
MLVNQMELVDVMREWKREKAKRLLKGQKEEEKRKKETCCEGWWREGKLFKKAHLRTSSSFNRNIGIDPKRGERRVSDAVLILSSNVIPTRLKEGCCVDASSFS